MHIKKPLSGNWQEFSGQRARSLLAKLKGQSDESSY